MTRQYFIGLSVICWCGALSPMACADGFWSSQMQGWYKELLEQITTPLFWFGLFAQGLFFLRFIWQWIVSEQRKQSTIPILFWYFSLLGGVAMFIYGCLRKDLVIMLGQVMATVIYTRNLMLIYNEMARSREAGLSAPDARFSKNDTNKTAE